MKKHYFSMLFILCFLLQTFFAASCKNTLVEERRSASGAEDTQMCIVYIAVDKLSSIKSAYPSFADAANFFYEAEASNQNGSGKITSSKEVGSAALPLSSGKTWLITLKAYKTSFDKQPFMQGFKEIHIPAGNAGINIVIPLTPSGTGNGSIKLKVKQAIQGCSKIEYECAGKTETIPSNPAEVFLIDIKNVPVGNYSASFKFTDTSGSVIGKYYVHGITVYAGMETSKWFENGKLLDVLEIKKQNLVKTENIFISGTSSGFLKVMGNDKSGNGTMGRPFKTAAKGWELCTDKNTEYTIYIDGEVEGPFENGNKTGMKLCISGLNGKDKDIIKNPAGITKSVIHSGSGKALTLTLENLTIQGGNATEGGGIYFDSDNSMTIKNCSIKGNHAPKGSGVFLKNGKLTIKGNTEIGSTSASDSIYILKDKFIKAEGLSASAYINICLEDYNAQKGKKIIECADAQTHKAKFHLILPALSAAAWLLDVSGTQEIILTKRGASADIDYTPELFKFTLTKNTAQPGDKLSFTIKKKAGSNYEPYNPKSTDKIMIELFQKSVSLKGLGDGIGIKKSQGAIPEITLPTFLTLGKYKIYMKLESEGLVYTGWDTVDVRQ